MPESKTQVGPDFSEVNPEGDPTDRDIGVAAMDSTAGYAEQARQLIPKYDGYGFEQLHAHAIPHLPGPGCRVLDIGAGSGRDARWFAARGDDVIAVEPTAPLRDHGQRTSPGVKWIDARLPDLAGVPEGAFDIVNLNAVWMHFDADQRRDWMPIVAQRVGPGGTLLLSLRHGPPPAGRRMFPVTADETVQLAAREGLQCVETPHRPALGARNRALGVTWTYLVFRRPVLDSSHRTERS